MGARLAGLVLLAVLAAAAGPACGADADAVASRVRDAVERMLSETLGAARADIVTFSVPSALELADADALVARPPAGGAQPGYNQFTVEVRREGKPPRNVIAVATMAIEGPVVVATRALARGARLTPADLRLESRPWRRGEQALTALPDAAALTVKLPLRAGEPVRVRSVGKAYMVETGQRVLAVAESGGVTVELDTVARGRGDEGDQVVVEGSDRRALRGRVIGEGRVSVIGAADPSPRAAGRPR